MHLLTIGFISGALSGIIMGLLSHVLFRLNVFKSSLFVIDGSFFLRSLRLQGTPFLVCAAGLVIHLITSGVFGAIYMLAGNLLQLDATTLRSLIVISVYISLLWLSMLFIALPVAGEGFLGKKSGHFAWLEQLVLHVVFAFVYYGCLRFFLPQ